ncbi:MAG: hypothetical protein GC193_05570 [Cryomorphaceae bacterium]|nr:hypothetical protein [Cryomorphaceae bacterium]
MKTNLLKAIPHIVAIVLFAAISGSFFSPAFDGYELRQGDIDQFIGMSKEIRDFDRFEGEETLWAGNTFSGMPAFQISMQQHANLPLAVLRSVNGLFPRSVAALFLAMISFYILGLCLRINPWLSMIGAIAFGLSSINVLYLGAGHMSKVTAIALMPAVLGGVLLAYRGKALLGAAIVALFLGMQLAANHLQMTYYLMILVGAVALGEIVKGIIEKKIKHILTTTAFLLLAAVLAIAPNTTNILSTYSYSKESTRGKSELSQDVLLANGISSTVAGNDGLNKDYILEYSMSRGEFWSMMIPDIKGGTSGAIGSDKDVLEPAKREFRENIAQSNRYWGDQAFTGGAFYFGALIMALFLVAFFVVKDQIRWSFLVITLLAIVLSWKQASWLTDFFIEYVPLFSKFRDTKMMLATVQVMAPLMAMLLIQKAWTGFSADSRKMFLIGSGSVLALFLLFLAAPAALFGFTSTAEEIQFSDYLLQAGGDPQQEGFVKGYIDGLSDVRMGIFKADAMRSLLMVLIGLVILFFIDRKKFDARIGIAVIGLLVIFDLYSVDRRYFDNEKQGKEYARWVKDIDRSFPFAASQSDMMIYQQETIENPGIATKAKDYVEILAQSQVSKAATKNEKLLHAAQFGALTLGTNYRVLNIRNPFSDARTSYFHKSVGGYHGAKMKRYQEFIDFHFGPEIQRFMETANTLGPDVLRGMPFANMLNVKYLILDPNGAPLQNPYTFGNAWFVKDVEFVENADEEIERLYNVTSNEVAIIDRRFESIVPEVVAPDSTAAIVLTSYKPNHLVYRSQSAEDQLAVFSEVYYADGWQAYLDGEPVPHARANYILRALKIPAGAHEVSFVFESSVYKRGENISMIASILLGLFILVALFLEYKKQRQAIQPAD